MCGDTRHEHSFQDPTAQKQEVTPVYQGSASRVKGAHKQTGIHLGLEGESVPGRVHIPCARARDPDHATHRPSNHVFREGSVFRMSGGQIPQSYHLVGLYITHKSSSGMQNCRLSCQALVFLSLSVLC